MLSRTTGAHDMSLYYKTRLMFIVHVKKMHDTFETTLKFAHNAKKLKIIWRMYISCDTFYYNNILHSNEHNFYL